MSAPAWLAEVSWSVQPPEEPKSLEDWQRWNRRYELWLERLPGDELVRAYELDQAEANKQASLQKRRKTEAKTEAKAKLAAALSALSSRVASGEDIPWLEDYQAWHREHDNSYWDPERYSEGWRRLQKLKSENGQLARWKKFTTFEQRRDWSDGQSYPMANGGKVSMMTYDTRGGWAKDPEGWKNIRDLIWGLYQLLSVASHWPGHLTDGQGKPTGPDSAGLVLLDFIARLYEADLWVIPYSGTFASLRLGLQERNCFYALKWLREYGYLIYRAGSELEAMRYELNVNKLAAMLTKNQAVDLSNISTVPDVKTIPGEEYRRQFATIGGLRTIIISNYLTSEPRSVNRLAEITGWNRRTVSNSVAGLEKAGLAVKTQAGWVTASCALFA